MVAKYVLSADVSTWSRAHFPANRYNIMTTNNVESLNGLFKEERGWPIIALFDGILETFAAWFCKRREKAEKWGDILTKRTVELIDCRYEECLTMPVVRLSHSEAQVMDSHKKFEVDLDAMTCQCKIFQTDGIPCTHALALAKDRGIDPSTFVSPFYRNDTIKEAYKETIHLLPPVTDWHVPLSVASYACAPPPVTRGVGRPRFRRFKGHLERSHTLRCATCGMRGHTYRTCYVGKSKKRSE